MPDITSFNIPSAASLPAIPSISAPTLPSLQAASTFNTSIAPMSLGAIPSPALPKIPSIGGISNITAPEIPALPSLGSNLPEIGKTDFAKKLPKFDSKINLPEIESGKFGLLNSPVDLGNFKEKTMSSFDSIVPPFSPGQKIGALKDAASKKLSMLNSLKSAAGGVFGAAAAAALSGKNLKGVVGAAAVAAVGGVAGNLAGKIAGNSVVGGAIGSAIGGIAGSKLTGSSNKSALIGGLAAGAGAFVAASVNTKNISSNLPSVGGLTSNTNAIITDKLSANNSSPVAKITNAADQTANVPSSVDVVTTSNNTTTKPETQAIPPASPTATIDNKTGKVVLANTDTSNLTTVKQTVLSGGSRTRYADATDPVTGKKTPVPDKVVPPSKTVVTTIINKNTGEVISKTSETKETVDEQTPSESFTTTPPPAQETVSAKKIPIVLPRPINPLYHIEIDADGNEYLKVNRINNRALNESDYKTTDPYGLAVWGNGLMSIVGSKDTLVLTYKDKSTNTVYTPAASKIKFGNMELEGDSVRSDFLSYIGRTNTYVVNGYPDDFTYPLEGQNPYFVKNPDGSITYTFSDKNTATELPSLGKSLFTINGISADIDMPTIIKPTDAELAGEEVEKQKDVKKLAWLEKNHITQKDSNGDYIQIVDKFWLKGPERFSTNIVPHDVADKTFERQWNNIFLPRLKQAYAHDIETKYKLINMKDQIKTAESIDKMHIIEVTRSGHGDSVFGSYLVMNVRVYKKIEEVST